MYSVTVWEFKDGASKEIEYEYDANGNLTKDLNKKIADIQYNCLNLPEKVQFEGGNSISYLYAADGTKLRTTYKTGNATIITDYCGNAIYENGVLIKVLTEDGYITVSNNQFHYFIQDHQGNNRVVVTQNGVVEEVNDYYPFGGLLSSSLSNNVQPYKYNGKELNRDNGLDWYDYGARMYDASLGRWHAVDPSGEKYPALGLYAYCKNSPIIRIDPDGKDDYVVNANGAVYLMRKTDRIVDVLYASGINSSQKATQPDPNWKSIRVFDKSMLQGLTASKGEKGRDYWDRKLYTTTNSVYNAANVFLFVADNTSVEWTLKGGYMDGKRTFILGTNNNRNRVSSMYGLTKVQEALFPTFIPIIDIHSHPYNPFASPEDMDNARMLRDIRYGIYYKDNIINYTDQNNSTYSIKVNSMNDLMRYIFQQLR
ncbi:type IV secretion protein Rhs [Bacteroides thetaiotaomicron]|nr:type IV secretion protein Rhs [Bacteroides thetaiotaomicron]